MTMGHLKQLMKKMQLHLRIDSHSSALVFTVMSDKGESDLRTVNQLVLTMPQCSKWGRWVVSSCYWSIVFLLRQCGKQPTKRYNYKQEAAVWPNSDTQVIFS